MTAPIFTARVLCTMADSKTVNKDEVRVVEISGRFADRAAAESFIDAQPKMLRLKVQGIFCTDECNVVFRADFSATKGNDKNETGLKRTARALKVLVPVDGNQDSLNSATLADLARWMG